MPTPRQLIEQAKRDLANKKSVGSSSPVNVEPREVTGGAVDLEATPAGAGRFPWPSNDPRENVLLNPVPAERLLDQPGDDIGEAKLNLAMGPQSDEPQFEAGPQYGDGDYPEPPAVTDLSSSQSQQFPQWGEGPVASEEEQDRLEKARMSTSQRGMSAANRYVELYEPPPLPISDDDVIRFLECIRTNKYYSETLKKGPISVTFRVKSANELDFQRANLSRMMAMGAFNLMADYQDAISRFNLLLQVQAFNGQNIPRVMTPLRPWTPEKLNMEELFWNSPLAKLTESTLFIINGMMVQFENKIYAIEQRVLDPNFTPPGKPS